MEKQTESISVLQLTDDLEVGGLQRVVVNLTRWLPSAGCRVGVAASFEGRFWQEIPKECMQHYAPSKPKKISEAARYLVWLRRLIRTNNYQIVHAHQRGVGLLARIATIGLDVRTVDHVHNTFPPTKARFASFVGDHLIACGSVIARMLEDDYKRSPNSISVVLNAVEDHSQPMDESMFVGGNELPTIVAVGRMAIQKDPERFVRTIVSINHPTQKVTGTWVGDGPLRKITQELAMSKEAAVNFVGDVKDTRRWILSGDVLFLTSR